MTTAPSLKNLGFTGPEPMRASDRPRTFYAGTGTRAVTPNRNRPRRARRCTGPAGAWAPLVATTNRYAHLFDERDAEIAAAVDRVGREAGEAAGGARCATHARPIGRRLGHRAAHRPLTCGFTVGAEGLEPPTFAL